MEQINERDFIKKCEYYNCGKIIPDNKRSDARFCDRKCKSKSKRMRKYFEKKINQGIDEDMNKVFAIKNMKKIIKGDI